MTVFARRSRQLGVMGLALLACSSFLPVQPAGAEDLKKITYVFDWSTPDHELIPIVVAKDHGLYKDVGLDVEITFPPDSATTAGILLAGSGDLGFETTTDVAFGHEQGAPIVSIGNFIQTNNWCLFGKPGEPFDLTKLEGKPFGVYSDSWTKAMMPFVLKKAGLKPDQIKEVIVDSSMPLMLAGKIDIATNTENYGVAEVQASMGMAPSMVCARELGAPDVPIWVYTASQTWLDKNGDTATKFMAATTKATEWAVEHPDEAVALFGKYYPDNANTTYDKIGWNALLPYFKNADGKMMVQSADIWKGLAEALKATDQIKEVPDPNVYFTNKYLPQ
jgi:NitT/TauT family transport system substrate-binding protein